MNLCIPIILVLLVCIIALVGLQYTRKVEKFNDTECTINEDGSNTCTIPGDACIEGRCRNRDELIRNRIGQEG